MLPGGQYAAGQVLISVLLWLAIRQKQQKPLAMDARCLLRAIDAAAARKSLSKLRHFQSAPSSPLQGLCIYRKAINKNKPQSSGVLPSRQRFLIEF